jgi:hypothetical protein
MRRNQMKNSELNNQQTDWLAQTEEINDTEASQVNGGAGDSVAAGQQSAQDNLATQQANADAAKEFQDQSTAISTDAQFAMKTDQAYQSLVQSIKTM